MKTEFKSSILLSIFKRKGGEGVLTKIVTEDNKFQYEYLFNDLLENERRLIVFCEDFKNWMLITNQRIIDNKNDVLYAINYHDLIGVRPAFQKELNIGYTSIVDFSYLLLEVRNTDKYLLRVEKGEPYKGILQLLSYVASG